MKLIGKRRQSFEQANRLIFEQTKPINRRISLDEKPIESKPKKTIKKPVAPRAAKTSPIKVKTRTVRLRKDDLSKYVEDSEVIKEKSVRREPIPKLKPCYVRLSKLRIERVSAPSEHTSGYRSENVPEVHALSSISEDVNEQIIPIGNVCKKYSIYSYRNSSEPSACDDRDDECDQLPQEDERRKIDYCFPASPRVSYSRSIEDTNFVVDYFGCDFGDFHRHFLTRYHMRQISGLDKTFKQNIYLTSITARLVHVFLEVDKRFLKILTPNEPRVIDGVEVTAIEVPRYPGAVMFLFKLDTGRCILHAGEILPASEIEECAALWSNYICKIYIDSAFLTQTMYQFAPNDDRYYDIIDECKTFLTKHHQTGLNGLIVCGVFDIGIGFEFLLLKLALSFKVLIWMDRNWRNVYSNKFFERSASNDQFKSDWERVQTKDPSKALIHIVPVENIQKKFLSDYLHRNRCGNQCFHGIMAIRPRSNGSHLQCVYENYPFKIVDIPNPMIPDYNRINRFFKFILEEKSTEKIFDCPRPQPAPTRDNSGYEEQ